MRIGFDAKRITHNFRGLGNYSRSLVEGLIQYHPEFELFLYAPPPRDSRAFKWLQDHQQNIQLRTPQVWWQKLLHPRWRSHWIVSDIAKDQIDLFHGLSHELPLAPKSKNCKWVVTIHDLIFMRYPNFYPKFDRMTYEHKIRAAVRDADLVIAICEQTKNDLIHYLEVPAEKIAVHYQSTSPIYYAELSKEFKSTILKKYDLPEFYILNVGALEERKNQINLVKAFAQIANKVEHDLVLVGKGNTYKTQLVEVAQTLGVSNRVHIKDNVSTDDLPAIYQSASVFCFTSFFEGFGIPITEAQFSRTPVIVSQGSCFPECASPESLFVNPNDPEHIANNILDVLANTLLREQMIAGGLKFVQKFSLQNSSHALAKIYKNLLAHKS